MTTEGAQLLRRLRVPTIIFVIVGAIFLGRGFEFVENPLIDLRLASQTRAVNGDIVVVAIDPNSLAALGAWPWRRAQHADVIDRLHQLGAGLVAVDIDLSSAGDPADDAALAEALARNPENTILAAFTQRPNLSAGSATKLLRPPLDILRTPGSVAAITLRPDSDGRIRRMPLFEDSGRTLIPTLSTALAAGANTQPALSYIDLSFDPATVPMLSYVDVLNGDVAAELVQGRQAVIGVTSSQLGTHVPVPRYRVLPATLVHVLAAQSLLNGRALVRPTMLFTLVVTALLVFGLWHFTRSRRHVGRTAFMCGGVIAGSFAASFAVYALSPVLLDTAPWMLAAFLVFLTSTVEQLRSQRQRIIHLAHEQRRASGFMQLVFNTIGEAVLTVDMTGTIRSANAAAQGIFGRSRTAMIGESVTTLFPFQPNGEASDISFVRALCAAQTVGRYKIGRAHV